jgi:hypothetical protein
MANAQRTIENLAVYSEYQILRDYLMKQTRFVTQSQITADTGLSGPMTRKVCNAYPCLAVGTGLGYKLARYCSTETIQQATATLMNRSIKMLNRAQALSGLLAR